MTIQEIERYFTYRNIVTPWGAFAEAFEFLTRFEENNGHVTLVYSMEIQENNYAGNTPGKVLGVYNSSICTDTGNAVNKIFRYTKIADGSWIPQDDTSECNARWLDQFLDDTETCRLKFLGANISVATLLWLESYIKLIDEMSDWLENSFLKQVTSEVQESIGLTKTNE